MRIYILPPFICSCGYAVDLLPISMSVSARIHDRVVTCSNPQCQHFKKKFKLPSFRLEEIEDGKAHSRPTKTHPG